MDPIVNLLLFILFAGTILVIGFIRAGSGAFTVKGKLRAAKTAPWYLHDFLNLEPSRPKHNEYYRFNEESVRSHAHRFVGRFDGAILHWEEVPVLDLIVENKFPVNYLPSKGKREDFFQAGLYALALEETGVSCRDTKLVTIYCLQDVAKRCLQGNTPKKCWDCGEGKIFSQQFNSREIKKHLKKIDAVWLKKRSPKASPSEGNCRPCPYSKNGKCNYSAV
ncbi:MAG: hypothetical protein RTV72_07630 [Candidatus Thorarchaeota archaeon]